MKTLNIITASIIAFTLTACGPSAEEVAAAEQQNLVESYIKDQTNDFMQLVATPDPIDTAPEFFLRKPDTPWNKDMEDTPANFLAFCDNMHGDSDAEKISSLKAVLVRAYGPKANDLSDWGKYYLLRECSTIQAMANEYIVSYKAAEELAYNGGFIEYSVVEQAVRDGMDSDFYRYFASRPSLEGMDYSQLTIAAAYRKHLGLSFEVFTLTDGSEQVRYQAATHLVYGNVKTAIRQMRVVSNGNSMYTTKRGAGDELMSKNSEVVLANIDWNFIATDNSNMSKMSRAIARKNRYNSYIEAMRNNANYVHGKMEPLIKELK